MVVRVRLFAMLRERAGAAELELELPEGALVGDALTRMHQLAGGLPLVMAVNRVYAKADTPLRAGDELALIPPVSGGAGGTGAAGENSAGGADGGPPACHVRITGEPLSLDRVSARVRDPRAGAVVSFQGVTRRVPRLSYEAYVDMAHEQIERIVETAVRRHGLCAAAAEHRVGTVALSEPSVIVAASAPHRGEAFAGAREIIDEIKARAPIWKQEIEEDEEARWVTGTPPPL